MGRIGRVWCAVLTALCSCNIYDIIHEEQICKTDITISVNELETRAADPDENKISELTLMVFDENGFLESRKTFERWELGSKTSITHSISLLKGKKYNIYACANIGLPINAKTIEELNALKFHLVYPDEYRTGLPMAGWVEGITVENQDTDIHVRLERLMAKISLNIDRGGLSEDVTMNVVSAKIGNCPRSARIFTENSVESGEECFASGFTRTESECTVLNRNIGNGLSGTISMYMLENMQGQFNSQGITDDSEKVFDTLDVRQQTCSYVELRLDYQSEQYHTLATPLLYRFYLGKDRNSLDVERNCHYHITVIPEDDGLSDDSWRVDKRGLEENSSGISFEMTPSGYIQGYVGDSIHVRCIFSPADAEFEIGLEELEFDRERGIYDYTIDPDGHGVVLTLKSPGTGIVYMTAGDPINEAGMLLIEVNNIKNTIS